MTTPGLRLLIPAFLAAMAAAFAQRPGTANPAKVSPEEALALAPDWLRHGGAHERAWAAYWVERYQQQQEVPQLLEALASYQKRAQADPSAWGDDDTALQSVLDALIQLKGDVPPDSAEALYARFPVQALILLERSPGDASDALLGILDKSQSIEWLAAADLLAARPPDGFAARLLKGISIHATIQVLDPGQHA